MEISIIVGAIVLFVVAKMVKEALTPSETIVIYPKEKK